MIDSAFGHSSREISDARNAKYIHSLMTGGDSLGYGGHSNGVRSEHSVKPDLRRRFVGWSRKCAVNSSMQKVRLYRVNSIFESFARGIVRRLICGRLQIARVNFSLVRKSRAET